MQITTYQHADAFLARTRAALEREEALNSLLYGLALRIKESPEWLKVPPYLATVDDDQGLVLAGLMTPPHNLILFANRDNYQPALDVMAHNLIADHRDVPGTIGLTGLAQDFAAVWSRLTGARCTPGMKSGIYELRAVILPPPAPGRMRLATATDTDLIARWLQNFQIEAIGNELSPDAALEAAAQRSAVGEIYLWDNGQPVSMAAKARPTPNGITVNYVYTPPDQRGKGYASSCVAALSQSLLDVGYQFCTLFTDLTNPTSNGIYQRMGYRYIGEFGEYL
ncbi:MAG: GNAT family N-acetyltransferase, partial [Anaerolineae bacterium]|nr:GNAT family N-acetyltransferase [Anaerolineae bacterium]